MKKTDTFNDVQTRLAETFNFHLGRKTITIDKPAFVYFDKIFDGYVEVILKEALPVLSTLSLNIFINNDNYIVVGGIDAVEKVDNGYHYTVEVVYLSEELAEIIDQLIDKKRSFLN